MTECTAEGRRCAAIPAVTFLATLQRRTATNADGALFAMWSVALAAVLGAGSSALSTTSAHVRAPSPLVQSLLVDASALPTTAALLRRLEASDQVVYIVFTDSPEIPIARTKLVTAARGVRFLRIDINVRVIPGDRLPILAHELQHAVELADAPDVRDDEGVRQLYLRIGSANGRDHFETTAARNVERQVRREVSARTTRAGRTPKV